SVAAATAFPSGLVGWTLAVLVGNRLGANVVQLAALALVLCFATVWMARVGISLVARWFNRKLEQHATSRVALELAVIGWTDWLLASIVFVACLRAAGSAAPLTHLARSLFLRPAICL